MERQKSWQQYFISFYNDKGTHVVTYSKLVHSKVEALDYIAEKYGKVFSLVVDKVI